MTFIDFYRAQHKALPITLPPTDCRGRTYIVTGANAGLGYHCAQQLVRLGAARVVMAVRNLSSGRASRAAIEAATGLTGVLEVWHLDLASYDSVKAFAAQVAEKLDRVDALVENAGVAMERWVEAEGRELTLTTNVFSTLLLAVLMLPCMERTAREFGVTPRIAIVGSNAAFMAEDAFDMLDRDNVFGDLNNREKWEPKMASFYPMSKLLLHLAYRALAAAAPVSQTGVVVNLSSPGLCYTGLTRNVPFLAALPIHAMRLLVGRSAEKGSRTLLAGVAAGEESHGRYLTECEVNDDKLPLWMTDESGQQLQQRIWLEVSEFLEKSQPGCLDAMKKA